jgi:hypothetical protein
VRQVLRGTPEVFRGAPGGGGEVLPTPKGEYLPPHLAAQEVVRQEASAPRPDEMGRDGDEGPFFSGSAEDCNAVGAARNHTFAAEKEDLK